MTSPLSLSKEKAPEPNARINNSLAKSFFESLVQRIKNFVKHFFDVISYYWTLSITKSPTLSSLENKVKTSPHTNSTPFSSVSINSTDLKLNYDITSLAEAFPQGSPQNPTRSIIHGDLDLSQYPNIRTLPTNLEIRGNFILGEYGISLDDLPEGFCVSGGKIQLPYLPLTQCLSEKRLPPNLHIRRDLVLATSLSLAFLPEGLQVDGRILVSSFEDINLSNFSDTSINNLPANIHISNNLVINNKLLKKLPAGLKVSDNANFSGCDQLETLPDDFHVGGSLNLSSCRKLTNLPGKDLVIKGDLLLLGCLNLETLPSKLEVKGNLSIRLCKKLEKLPDTLIVHGDLSLICCDNLKTLPAKLIVYGNLSLVGCNNLTTLPANLVAKKGLLLNGCSRLEKLPGNLLSPEKLTLVLCDSPTILPDNLHIKDALHIESCSELEKLPENLHVGGDLTIRRCANLKTLPETLLVEANKKIDCSGCSSLTTLPTWLDKYLGTIDLTGTAVPLETRKILKQKNKFLTIIPEIV